MAETEMFDALQAGSVTEQQYMNSCAAAGHSEKTAKKYYRIAKGTVSRTQTGFATLMGDEVESTPSPILAHTTTTPVASPCEPVVLSMSCTPPSVLRTGLTKRPMEEYSAPAEKRVLAEKVTAQAARGEVIAQVALCVFYCWCL
jgi:hypothetical protein